MAIIVPFRGVRYNPAVVPALDAVVTQPYDKISPAMQKAYYDESPYNFVRIILGMDDPNDDKYQRAATLFQDWIQKKVVLQDAEPSLYVYHQTYTTPTGARKTRRGIIALGKMNETKVHAHEHTLAGPKVDRFKLLSATQTNFEHIFMLYDDPTDQANQLLAPTEPPLMEAHDEDGNHHQLWKISDPERIQSVQASIRDRELFIADGHHRYETSLNYRRQMLDEGKWRPSMDYRMMTLVNVRDEGLTILPTHRLFMNVDGFSVQDVLKRVQPTFTVKTMPDMPSLLHAMEECTSSHAFGLYADHAFYLLTLADEAIVDRAFDNGVSPACRRLDVSLLHQLLLKDHLGITPEDQLKERKLAYVRDPKEAVQRVDEKEFQGVFFLNPTRVEDVISLATQGEKMPQKSTDFYPKLLSGFTIYVMD